MPDTAAGRATRPARHDQRGASAVEYALLLAGIAGTVVLAVFALGELVPGLFEIIWPTG
ncbi:MAG TPA: Flp family type IVb pilin [Nocardioides sp.]